MSDAFDIQILYLLMKKYHISYFAYIHAMQTHGAAIFETI